MKKFLLMYLWYDFGCSVIDISSFNRQHISWSIEFQTVKETEQENARSSRVVSMVIILLFKAVDSLGQTRYWNASLYYRVTHLFERWVYLQVDPKKIISYWMSLKHISSNNLIYTKGAVKSCKPNPSGKDPTQETWNAREYVPSVHPSKNQHWKLKEK